MLRYAKYSSVKYAASVTPGSSARFRLRRSVRK